MASNVYQFIDLPRIEPSKRPLKIRKTTFKEVYRIFMMDKPDHRLIVAWNVVILIVNILVL